MKLGNMHEIDFCIHFKEDSTNKEAAWKHLKPSLHCGQSQMAFRATGHSAADIQLDIGIVLVICCVYR